MYKCKKCSKELKNKGGYAQHIKHCKLEIVNFDVIINEYKNGLSYRDLKKKYNCSVEVIRKIIGDNARSTSESQKLAHKLKPDSFKHSDETKAKLREKRLKWMKDNPEKTAWRCSNLSYPEKRMKDYLDQIENQYNYRRQQSTKLKGLKYLADDKY